MALPARTRPAAVVIVLIVALATGCGSGGRSPSPGTAASTPAARLWTGPTLTTTAMSDTDARAIDAVGEQIIAEMGKDLPGVWIGVWDAKKGYHIGAYGKAALPDTPATVSDHSRIGSISKTFTAATIMRLADQGKLRMNATVEEVLPHLAERYPALAAITVAQLINMTSGIPDYVNTGAIFKTLVNDPKKMWTPAELIELSQTMPNAKPGTLGYTSTATIILGEMIAAVSGQSLEQAINQTAHDAGLTHTALLLPSDASMPVPASHGYLFTPGANSLKEEFDSLYRDVTSRIFDVYGDDTVVYPGHGDDTTLGEERPRLDEWRERGW